MKLIMPFFAASSQGNEKKRMFKQMTREINAINTVLRERDIDAYVAPESITYCIPGNFIRYAFTAQTEKARDSLKSLGDRWTALISEERGESYELPVVFNKNMFILDTPGLIAHQPPQWTDAPLNKLRPGDLLFGQAFTDRKSMPMIVNLRDPSTPHALVAATTGGGKTFAVVQGLLGACYATNPKKLLMYVLDPKGVLLELEQLPHVTYKRGADDCATAMGAIITELDRRTQTGESTPQIIIMIDELVDLIMTGGNTVQEQIQRVAQIGRERGIHLLVGTQNPTAKELGSTLKRNLPYRLVGKVDSATASTTAAGKSGIGAEGLIGTGAFYSVGGARVYRVQTYNLPRAQWPGEIAKIAEKWGEADAAQIPEVEPVPSRAEEDAARIRAKYSVAEIFKEDADPTVELSKQLNRGMQTKIIRHLYGEEASTTGHNRDKALAALRLIRDMTKLTPQNA